MPATSPPSRTALTQKLALDIRAIHRVLKQRVREHGASGKLTPAQVSVLARLEKDGASTVSSLARAEAIRPQSMSEIVAPLLEGGLVDGQPDPDDRRQTLMSLTPKCLAWIEEGRTASHDWLASAIAGRLSAPEQEKLRDALELLRRVIDA